MKQTKNLIRPIKLEDVDLRSTREKIKSMMTLLYTVAIIAIGLGIVLLLGGSVLALIIKLTVEI